MGERDGQREREKGKEEEERGGKWKKIERFKIEGERENTKMERKI